jgi:NAD(P)-dependent dehydrogenase (short-subunit alcohol dehydrogenase family)
MPLNRRKQTMGKLDGKIALVTGASRNIGRAIAQRFAREGADMAISSMTGGDNLAQTAGAIESLGRKVYTKTADVADPDQVRDLVASSYAHFGRIDLLVHTVAVRPHAPFESLTRADWESVRSTVLDSAFHITQATLPGMREQGYGRVILFTGAGSYRGHPQRAHVSAAKMGIVGLTRGLASEYAPHGVRLNIVAPGNIDTARANPEWYGNAVPSAKGIPMQRMGTAEEIAAACLFLVDDECAFITGETLHVNGGQAFI